MRIITWFFGIFSLILGCLGIGNLAYATKQLDEDFAKIKLAQSGYDLLIEAFKGSPLVEQLNAPIVDRKAFWQNYPEDCFKLGNYYIGQLKEYWATSPLAQEVALEISSQTESIVQQGEFIFELRSPKVEDLYTKLIAAHKLAGVKILGDTHNPRQVVRFKYVGDDHPQTPLGQYLQKELNPRGITLVFDPQSTMIQGHEGSFGGKFESQQGELVIGPALLATVLAAPDERTLQEHETFIHELGHYQLEFDHFQHKIPLLFGEVAISGHEQAVHQAALAWLAGETPFPHPSINFEEGYTHHLSAAAALQMIAPELDPPKLTAEDLSKISQALQLAQFSLRTAAQHLHAASQVAQTVLPLLDQTSAPTRFFRNRYLGDRLVFVFPLLLDEQDLGPQTSCYLSWLFPAQLWTAADNASASEEIMVPVPASTQDIHLLKAYLQQQNAYVRKLRQDNQRARYLINELVDAFEGVRKNAAATPQEWEAFMQHWQPVLQQLKANLGPLTQYPPFFEKPPFTLQITDL